MAKINCYCFVIFFGCFFHSINAEQVYSIQTKSSIYVLGDINGSFSNFEIALRHIGLIDDNNQWSAGKSHFVSLGNLISIEEGTAEDNKKIVELVMLLKRQAKNSGGGLHVVMGENELNNLIKELDNTSLNVKNGGGEVKPSEFKIYPLNLQWLTDLPFVVKINEEIFAHGGLAKSIKDNNLNELNERLKRELTNALLAKNKTEKTKYLSLNNPANYQGNLICHPFFETENLQTILNRFQARRLWSGSSIYPEAKAFNRLDQQLVVLNGGNFELSKNIVNKDSVVVGEIKVNGEIAIYNALSNQNINIADMPNRNRFNTYGMSDEQITEFMRTAEIIKKETTDYGITKPYKVLMEKDGKALKGIFKYFDSRPGNNTKRWTRDTDYTDRYQYEVAAYQIDKMLGIGLVPIAVERTLEGQAGVLILWVDDLISELKMSESEIRPDMICDLKSQTNMMNTFDYLIRNIDRNQSNTLFDKNDWQLWFIDHSRSFSSTTRRQEPLKKANIKVTRKFKAALESMTYEQVAELSSWLHSKQIKGLWARRNKLISGRF